MGKNLKGKELGKGLTQRADGRYYARFVTKEGERKGQYFKKLSDARGWLKNAQNEDKESPSTPVEVITGWIILSRICHGIRVGIIEIGTRITSSR